MKVKNYKNIIGRCFAALLALSLAAGLSSCGNNSGDIKPEDSMTGTAETETQNGPETLGRAVNIAVLAGPTGMGAASLMNEAMTEYSFTVATAPDQVAPSLISGEYDIAAIPTNLAATLYQKTGGGIQVLAVNTGGVLYILENGSEINSVADLRGKTVYATGQASTPEYILNHILRKNGIEPGQDIQIEYLSEHSELAAKLASGDAMIGMLPEPNVTAALSKGGEGLRIALDLTEEWGKIAVDESSLLQGCIAVRREFAEKYPDAVEDFLNDYRKSVGYITSGAEDVPEIIFSQGIVPSAAVAKKALPNCNICFIDGNDMKQQLSGFLRVLYDADPKSVGGSLPGDDFYYGTEAG